MKIDQVRASYYFEFLRIIYSYVTYMHTVSTKYDSHALMKNWNADFFILIY